LHAAVEEFTELALHLGRVHPIVGGTRKLLGSATDKRPVLDTGDITRVGTSKEAVRSKLVVQPDEGAGIEGAVMIDFYRDDFASELAKLDPEVPYVLYCRSGNRSGQTGSLMTALGLSAVDDVDGGIIAWQNAGLPLVTE